MTNWLAGMRITPARLNDRTSATTTTGLTAATGFTVSSFRGRKVAGITVIDALVTRSGADLVPATAGNISPDVLMCTFPVGWRPIDQTANAEWDNGTAEGGCVIGTDGLCTLRTANGTISTSTNLRVHLEFISDNN